MVKIEARFAMEGSVEVVDNTSIFEFCRPSIEIAVG
jgi:hypothetical protein